MLHTQEQYDQAIESLNDLLDIVGDDEMHPLSDVLDTLSVLIENYEAVHYPAPRVTGVDVLRYLMEEHKLNPESFPELGGRDGIAELLEGLHELTAQEIRALAQRFGLSPATFF